MNRILLTGGSGLLALNWALAVREQTNVVLGLHKRPVSVRGVSSRLIDISSPQSALRDLREIDPDLVVHTAGLTNIEQCEADPVAAFFQNNLLAQHVAHACLALNVKLVHISTDHLFDGCSSFSSETTRIQPKNNYAKSKAEAEYFISQINSSALIIRTNFFGWGTKYRSSFSDQIIQALRANKKINLFNDIFYTPILAERLALEVMELVNKNATGIFHVASDNKLSKFDFGIRIAEEFGFDKTYITPVSFSSRPDLVSRPQDMSLCNAKAVEFLGHKLGTVESHLSWLQQQEKQGIASELITQ